MNNAINIASVEVRVNFESWEKFNHKFLTNDGIILFQYLVFRCHNVKEWTHSDNEMQSELGIKRTRLETLRQKFIDLGILETRVIRNKYDNKITAYSLQFEMLAHIETLKHIYKEVTISGQIIDLKTYAEQFQKMAKAQPGSGTKAKDTKTTTPDQVRTFAEGLITTFDQRRKNFNTEQNKKKKKNAVGSLKFSNVHINKLRQAMRHFEDNEFIRGAWVAFCDGLNNNAVGQSTGVPLPDVVKDPLRYFLSHSSQSGGNVEAWDDETIGTPFAAIHSHAAYYASAYSRS